MKQLFRTLLVLCVATVVAYVGWDRVEAYRLHRVVADIAGRGEPIEVPSQPPALPSPQHEEAARLYAAAADRAREIGQQDPSLSRWDIDTVIGAVDIRGLEELYRPDAPALQLLDRATVLPFAGFGDAFDGPEWQNTQGLQLLSTLSALRSDLLAYRGQGDAAAPALIAAVRIQRTFSDIFQRYVIGVRQFGSLRILLRHSAPSPSSLETLQQAFAELPDDDGIAKELIGRRARLIEAQADGVYAGGMPALGVLAFHPFLLHMVRAQLEQFPEVLDAAALPWPDKYTTLTAIGASSRQAPPNRSPLRDLLAGRSLNIAAISATPVQAGLNLCVRRIAITALAIERYRRAHPGAPPTSLATLVPAYLPAVPLDPFSGDPLVYKLSPDAYAVYSIDANRIDNGGEFYGHGAMSNAMPKVRDFGIRVPLTPRPVRQ